MVESSEETGSGEGTGQDPGQLGGGRAAKAYASHPAQSNPSWPGRLTQRWPQGDYAPGPSLDGPTAFLTPRPGETPSNGPEPGQTDKCDKDGRSGWREGHLTYQVALQEGCGRRGGETEKERMCERQPDGQSHSWGSGGGPGSVGPFCRLPEGPGLGCREAPSVPPNRFLCPG